MITVTVAATLVLLLASGQLGHSCVGEGTVLICQNIPSDFRPGYLTLVMFLRNVGEISSTDFRSNSLSSVTRLTINNAGVTGIAEGAFGSFQYLTSLSLNNNQVTQINPKWFSQPAVLTELSLADNQIEVVNASMLTGLVNLTKLSLNRNRIRNIDPNSFSFQTNLASLDLSENRMTQVSPQVFSSLRSARIRLDGNPWNCSCDAKHSVDYLRDLQSRSQLDKEMEVTCKSPPSLKDRPVWNVSVCETSPTPSGIQTVQPKPSDVVTAVPVSSAALSRPTSKTKTSVQPKSTEAPLTRSLHTAAPPVWTATETKTSVHPKPTSILTTDTMKTETCVTSEPPLATNTVYTLIIVIVALCVLLVVVCFLAALHRRKRNNKTVIPARTKEERRKPEEDSRSMRDRSPGHSEERDQEAAWRRPFTGVRAKSANAILLMSPVCVSGKDQVTFQKETEAQSTDTANQVEGKSKLVNETEAAGGIQTETLSDTIEEKEKQADAGRILDENTHRVSVLTETVPYLSIGANPDELHKQFTDSPVQKSLTRKVMGRISTWPPTAVQWQARCKMQEEEDRSGGMAAWTQKEIFKFSGELKKIVNKVEHPSGSDQDQMKGETEKNQIADLQTAPLKGSPNPNDKTTPVSEADTHTDKRLQDGLKKKETIQDAATERQANSETPTLNLGQNPYHKPAEKHGHKPNNKPEDSNEAKPTVMSRQRGENRTTGSKAPSGGASPDDETLLSGNEYAFMDLLHEVVQNNGRWTRERWKRTHTNKQGH